MKRLWRLIAGGTLKDLLKYKSFFLLVFLLFVADRAIKLFVKVDRSQLQIPSLTALSSDIESALPKLANYIFLELPNLLFGLLSDPRTFGVLIGLFLMKQAISLWPSSDMRRMHRLEREAFGLFTSLKALKWDQLLWDAIALSLLIVLGLLWSAVSFFFASQIWGGGLNSNAHLVSLVSLSFFIGSFLPLGFAGLSYSSKLAVINQGTFQEKFLLFLLLFTDKRVFFQSYLFFSLRLILEVFFVAIVPAGALFYMENPFLRILVAGLSATPVYSFVKMASFKFFLFAYQPYDLVQGEYGSYYKTSQ
ncbi:MAG: hypothetical protein QNL04_03145 [SAR324 cluster bacterium]|nr:hypothetical protein [SAR324 cluster bacterium]